MEASIPTIKVDRKRIKPKKKMKFDGHFQFHH